MNSKFHFSKLIKIKYIGLSTPDNKKHDLILNIIEKVTGRQVELVSSKIEADLLIVYPYVVGDFLYKARWLIDFVANLFLRKKTCNTDRLRWLLGVGEKSTLIVSHENLDRPYWWNMIGKFIIASDVPRLTYWPQEVDQKGVRFPYWYNYIDWPEYPRPDFYQRFGRLYKIQELMEPLPIAKGRLHKAVCISSHLDHPRNALLEIAKKRFGVDCFGLVGAAFNGPKIKIMEKYKYAFCPENSTGYGYDTEKVPEAWVSGCIPIGISFNPFSQFNPAVILSAGLDEDVLYREPLLVSRPTLLDIEKYIREIL